MMTLPEDLRQYFQVVVESNERIVELKRRQLNPNLVDDDNPWLAAEQQSMAGMLKGFADHFGNVERDEKGAVVSGDPAAGEAEALQLFDSLVTDPATWKTWEDVFTAAEKMNARIETVLKNDGG